MTIVLTGGGTGGHITPILAVARELKRLHPDCKLIYIGERNGKFAELTKDNPLFDRTYSIFAGKFRRYHGTSLLSRLLDIKSNLLNIRDVFYVLIGIIQSWRLLGKLKPNVLFQKGGFVGMPVGMAAALRKIPFVTHDSDILPGLANRVVSRWARFNATGMPAEYYSYPKDKVRHVGVLVAAEYQPVTPALQKKYKDEIGLPPAGPVLFVTGGSQGSRAINQAVLKVVPGLLEKYTDLQVVHQVGKGNLRVYGEYTNPRLLVLEFLDGMYRYSGAADIIISRAGANTMAEFGVQGKACLIIPNPLLTGGHQLKNTEYLLQQGAIIAADEKEIGREPEMLTAKIEDLLTNTDKRKQLGLKLQAMTVTDATQRLAALILETAA